MCIVLFVIFSRYPWTNFSWYVLLIWFLLKGIRTRDCWTRQRTCRSGSRETCRRFCRPSSWRWRTVSNRPVQDDRKLTSQHCLWPVIRTVDAWFYLSWFHRHPWYMGVSGSHVCVSNVQCYVWTTLFCSKYTSLFECGHLADYSVRLHDSRLSTRICWFEFPFLRFSIFKWQARYNKSHEQLITVCGSGKIVDFLHSHEYEPQITSGEIILFVDCSIHGDVGVSRTSDFNIVTGVQG